MTNNRFRVWFKDPYKINLIDKYKKDIGSIWQHLTIKELTEFMKASEIMQYKKIMYSVVNRLKTIAR